MVRSADRGTPTSRAASKEDAEASLKAPMLRRGQTEFSRQDSLTKDGENSGRHRLRDRRASRAFSALSKNSGLLYYELTLRQKVWQFLNSSLLEEGPRYMWSKRFEYFCALLIFLNVGADVLDSVPYFPFTEDSSPSFRILERLTCFVFTVEYLLRAWSCVEAAEFTENRLPENKRRWSYLTSTMPLIDLMVVIVFYLDIFMSSDESRGFQSLRVIRTLRLVALFKMERQTQSFATVFRVFSKRRHDLFATLFLAMVLLIIASTAMYYVEQEAQPDKFASIPDTMWWSVTAMTTVGYGDIYPVTIQGKILGSIVAFLGVGLFALPSGIISSGFVEVLEEARMADADDLADILDEDKASLDKLREEVHFLRTQLDLMGGRLTRSEEDAHEARQDQKRALAMLEQLVQQSAAAKQS